MELTLEQQSAIKRGEAVAIHVPIVDEECILMTRTQYIKMQDQLDEEAAMHQARERLKSKLSSACLTELAKTRKAPASWYEEDHTNLYDLPNS
jgi:hypothetical protein